MGLIGSAKPALDGLWPYGAVSDSYSEQNMRMTKSGYVNRLMLESIVLSIQPYTVYTVY